MYDLITELSYDYSDTGAFVGDAGKIEFEVSGVPGLASSIAWACNQWVQTNSLYMETFAIYQDVEPFFDKYKVYMVFHESPIVWAIILPLIPLLIKAIALLGVSFLIWKIATVVFSPPQPTLDKETITAISPIIEEVNKMNISPDKKAEIITALLKGAGTLPTTPAVDTIKWLAIGAIVIGSIMVFSNLTSRKQSV